MSKPTTKTPTTKRATATKTKTPSAKQVNCPLDGQPMWRHIVGTNRYYDRHDVVQSHPKPSPKKGGTTA